MTTFTIIHRLYVRYLSNNQQRKMRALLLFLSIFIFSCKSTVPLETPVVETTPKTESIAESANSVGVKIDSIFAASGITGFSIVLVKNDKIAYEKSGGFANINKNKKYTNRSIQNIASVSKTLIAVSIMKAIDQGKVELDADINTYLPFTVRNPNHPNTPITLRQLATHTSSILDSEDYMRSYYFMGADKLTSKDLTDDYAEYFDMVQVNTLIDESEFLKNVLTENGKWYSDDVYSDSVPGDDANYSNVAATLAAYVIENAVGMSYEDYTQKYIFAPLAMNDTSWDIDTYKNPQFATRYFSKDKEVPDYYLITKADGGLYTCTEDFSKFMIEMGKGSKGKGTILSKESYAEMFTPQFTIEDEAFGIFWEVDPKTRSFSHSGGDPGVTTNVAYSTEHDRALIIFTNIEANEKTYSQIVNIWNTFKLYDSN